MQSIAVGDLVEMAANSAGQLYSDPEFKPEHLRDSTTRWFRGTVTYVYQDNVFFVVRLDRVPGGEFLPISWLARITPSESIPIWRFAKAEKPEVVRASGLRCIDCGEFYEYANEPNHAQGLVCYPCRTSNAWRWAAGLIVKKV